MASQSLISAVNSYDNYIQRKGIDEQVIDAYIEACRVAINGEKDITYGLHITNRSKGIVERFCMERTGGTIWDLEKYSFANKTHYSLTDKLYWKHKIRLWTVPTAIWKRKENLESGSICHVESNFLKLVSWMPFKA